MTPETVIFHYNHQINKVASILLLHAGCYSVWHMFGNIGVENTNGSEKVKSTGCPVYLCPDASHRVIESC
jgi:hypothetical protein